MHKPHRFLFVIGLVALVALLLATATTAAPAGQSAPETPDPDRLPAPAIQTASGDTLDKLSPDLRQLAAKPDAAREVMITALLAADAPTAPVQRLMVRSAVSKPLGDVRWVTGVIKTVNLGKLAGSAGLIGVVSTETFAPVTAPDLDEFRQLPAAPPVESVREALLGGGKAAAGGQLASYRPQPAPARSLPVVERTADGRSVKTADIHNVDAAHAKGYTGDGVVVAVVDSGVDFGNPDLQGTQARLAGGPYDGWPFAYDTISGANYALGELTYGPDNWADVFGATYYVHTLPVENPTCSGATCSGKLIVDYGSLSGWDWDPVELTFTWPNKSESGTYYYSIHPDPYLTLAALAENLDLGYGADFVPPALILADEGAAGVYDTVYVDLDFDQDLADEIGMRRGAELAGVDLYDAAGQPGSDGVWDLSAGMLTWIADGTNPPPGVGSLYEDVAVPEAGRLVAFVGDVESHGTNVAGMIAGQSRITDPAWLGPINPLYAGAADIGGAGGPVAKGMAPAARIAAVANGWSLPIDAWVAAVVGFDGAPESGDEAQLVNNSWGYSDVVEDGWDFISRFGQYLNFTVAPTSSLLVATGNGGPGYGTTAMPNGSTLIGVGASTSFGSLVYWGLVTPPQFTYGAVIPWSNRGPGAQEAADPELLCVGAFGAGVNPLNVSLRSDPDGVLFANGQSAYDAFGGTSMASPVCAGVGAVVYDAYRTETGEWPNFQQVRDFLTAGAADLGYDPMTQGAGNANAGRSADIAAGAAVAVTPTQWMVGDYRGDEFPAYIAVAKPGEDYQATLTVDNPTNAAANVNLSDTILQQVHETTFTVTLPPLDEDWVDLGLPNWLTNITALVNQYNPDLVVAETVFPLADFDPEGNFQPAVFADPHLYDWTDRNGDGNLWTDSDDDGFVGPEEIDIDGQGIAEFNIINYAAAAANNNMVSAGRNALSRRHNGIYLGLRGPWTDQTELTVNISLRFFRKTNWSWLSLSPGSVNVPARGERTVTATLAVPPDTRPGFYQGAIEYQGRVIPVTVNVAAQGTEFDFGATALDEPRGDQPFDNSHVSGYINWGWRPETGDWRFFYYDVPDGTAAPGKALLVDTRWPTFDTDVDTHIFAATPDDFSGALPDIFGPAGMAQAGASTNTWIGGGQWTFETATGLSWEVVTGPVSDGLGFIALHNVLFGGKQFADPVVGTAYSVQVEPYPAVVTTTRVPGSSPALATGEWTVTFESARAIDEGLQALVYGVGRIRDYRDQLALQDDPTDICTASYMMPLRITEGGALNLATTSDTPGLDIDLVLFGDDGDGRFSCETDVFVGGSFTPTADESIAFKFVPFGEYFVLVHGWNVPDGQARFDLTVQAIDGRDLTLKNLPSGPVAANTPVTFTVEVTTPFVPGVGEAVLYVGPMIAPTALQVPVTVEIPPAADAFTTWLPVAR